MNKESLNELHTDMWNKLMEKAVDSEIIIQPQVTFDIKGVIALQILREQELLKELPSPPDGYEYKWTEHTQIPAPPDFVAGWKLCKKHNYTDIYVSPEAFEDIKNWGKDDKSI